MFSCKQPKTGLLQRIINESRYNTKVVVVAMDPRNGKQIVRENKKARRTVQPLCLHDKLAHRFGDFY